MFDKLLCEHLENPLGIGTAEPRLSWTLTSKSPVQRQQRYRLLVAEDGVALDEGGKAGEAFWDSGEVSTSQSLNQPIGLSLKSQTRYHWKVKVFGEGGSETKWSPMQTFETAFLEGEWKPNWVGRKRTDGEDRRPTLLRRTFSVTGEVVRARLTISALGLYDVEVNGQGISEDRLVPGWTNYHVRNQYLTYDLGPFLESGSNAIGVLLGDGWYSGHLLFEHDRNFYGKHPAIGARIDLFYADGSHESIETDEEWVTSTGPYLMSDIYDGEIYDARLEKAGWSTPGYRARGWKPAERIPAKAVPMEAKLCPPVRTEDVIYPETYWQQDDNTWVYDFGQNLVGMVSIRLPKAKRGHKVNLLFFEMMHEDGTYYHNIRTARCMEDYIYSGKEPEGFVYTPKFTYHGFRYVRVTDYPGTPGGDILEGLVQYTALPETGSLKTSHKLLNRLVDNIKWSQRGNFVEVPTDCPQRSERLGWTGDAQVFIPAASYMMDLYPFFHKWLRDLRDDQKEDGAFPDVAPDILSEWRISQGFGKRSGTAAWGDAGTVCPWVLYERYGDERILEECFPSMVRWVAYCEKTSDGLIRHRTNFGDWLDPTVIRPGEARTSNRLLSTAYFARSTELTARAAEVLGKTKEARQLWELWERIRVAFAHEYLTPNGCLVSDSQTGYLLALGFDLLEPEYRENALDRLVGLFEERNYRIATGFVGAPLVCEVLSRFGRTDLAYKILLQEENPGWMFPVKNGATTMWERWDSWTPEAGFHPQEMNSFNHYAYGAIGNWLFQTAAGIRPLPESPGFQHFSLKPEPDSALKRLSATYESPYGRIDSSWKWVGRGKTARLEYAFSIPPNTEASVILPLVEGRKQFTVKGSTGAGTHTEEGYTFSAGPGKVAVVQR